MQSPAERLAVFQKMADADPTNELAHFSLGKTHLELGDAPAAERSLRRALELNPQHAQAHRFLGEALLKLGRRDEAVDILKRGIQLAHDKGEYQPRNQMQDALRGIGVEPPLPQAAKASGPAADGSPLPGAWVCRRCSRPNARLAEPPFLNDLGRKIQESICQPCWREWFAMSIKVINEYRLNLLSPQGNQVYEAHMKEFLGIED
ncbi:MAG: Fe(2+)-trafficking protein [Planctomycetes bacterium]|nr:Fe(2+)-trafficking protein [Planctomycetota bacterium]